MKIKLSALLMSLLLIQAAPPSTPEYRDGKYYEASTEKPYSGYFQGYFANTTLKQSEGKVREGLMDDVWTFYYANGQVKSELEYADGIKIKTLKSFYETGEVESLFDEQTQVFKTWYKSGKLKSRTQYVYGLKEGDSQEWFESGAIKSEYTYYSHHEHGVCKEYYENGQVALVSVYRDGKRSGYWQAFYPDGKLRYEGRYAEDFKTGKWITRSERGKVTHENF